MDKSSSKRVTIFAIILSLVAVGVLVFGFLMVSSNKVVLLQSISNLYGKFTDISDEEAFLLDKLAGSDEVGLRGNVNVKVGKDSYNIDYDYLENRKDSKSSVTLVGKNNDKELFNGSALLGNKNLYFYLKDITPDYYKVTSEYISIFKSVSSDDYDKLVTLLKDAIDSSIKNDDISKEKTIIKYNGKDKKVNKLTYSVDTNLIENILTKFVKSVKSDKTLLKNIANYLGMSSKELSKSLDDGLSLIKSSKNQELFKYQVYYYGLNKIVQYELYNKDYDLLLEYKVEDKESVNLNVGGVKYLYLEYSKNKKTYTFNGTLFDTYDFSGTFSDNLLELIFKFDKEYKLDIIYSNTNTENTFKSIYQITFSSKKNDVERKIFLADLDLEYYFGEKINSSVDVSNAIKLDDDNINELLEKTFGISLEELSDIALSTFSK